MRISQWPASRWRTFHGWATVFWAVNYALLPVLWNYPKLLLAYTAFCSVYANKVGHWSSWQASRTEERQEAMEDGQPS